MLIGKGRCGHGSTDPGQLANVATSDAAIVSNKLGEKASHKTYVSFTPHIFGHSTASEVIRSESKSIPPLAAGTDGAKVRVNVA